MGLLVTEDGDKSGLTVTERAVFVGWRLMAGDVWTTQEVANILGMSWAGAYQLLCKASRILPIYQNEEKQWTRIPKKNNK